jgi:HEPN domain-containing protein
MEKFFDKEEFDRWFSESLYTFESALHDKEIKFYNWACFKFQQAGEFAIKALLKAYGKNALGHSLLKLLEEIETLGISLSPELKSCARTLDMYYIGTRNPDAYPDGSPHEFFDENSANIATDCSQKIIDFVKGIRNSNV